MWEGWRNLQFSITSNGSTTEYKIVSASITGEAIFTGVVDSVTDTNVTFATWTDESNSTIYPFFASGSFNKDVQVPKISSPSPSSGAIPIPLLPPIFPAMELTTVH